MQVRTIFLFNQKVSFLEWKSDKEKFIILNLFKDAIENKIMNFTFFNLKIHKPVFITGHSTYHATVIAFKPDRLYVWPNLGHYIAIRNEYVICNGTGRVMYHFDMGVVFFLQN